MWETLGYAAALRLPRGMTAGQRAERVEAVLVALGLSKCRDTIIGGFFRRGISGGEWEAGWWGCLAEAQHGTELGTVPVAEG